MSNVDRETLADADGFTNLEDSIGEQFVVEEAPEVPPIIRRLANVASGAAGAAIVALMLITVVSVVMRRSTGRGLSFAYELTEVALVVVAFAGMLSALVSGAHVKTSIVTSRLKAPFDSAARSVGLLFGVIFTVWLTWQTLLLGLESFQIREYRFGLVRVPIWPAKAFVPVGIGLLASGLSYLLYSNLKATFVAIRAQRQQRAPSHTIAETTVSDVKKR